MLPNLPKRPSADDIAWITVVNRTTLEPRKYVLQRESIHECLPARLGIGPQAPAVTKMAREARRATPLQLLILRCAAVIGVCVEYVAAVVWLAEICRAIQLAVGD